MDTSSFEQLEGAQLQANDLRHHFNRFFRWNLLATLLLLSLALGGLGVATIFSRLHTANISAQAFLTEKRTYFLGLALSENIEGIKTVLIRENQVNRLVQYTFGSPGALDDQQKGLQLQIGGQSFGRITYRLNYRLIIFDQSTVSVLVALLIFASSLLSLYRRVNRFIETNLIDPLESLSHEISAQSDLSGLSALATPKDAINEIKKIHATLITTAASIQSSQEKLREIELLKALQKLATGVAHDIRSPLSALSVAAHSLDDVPEDIRQLIVQATDRIRSIANGLLDYNKQSLGDHSKQREVQEYLAALIEEKRLEWKNKSAATILFQPGPNKVYMEKVKLTELGRVVSNLINNALEASDPESGRAELMVRNIGEMVEISVEDNGMGIPEELLPRLGKEQISIGKSGESGNGIGVFQASGFARSLGGRLDIKSRRNQGTRITLALPQNLVRRAPA